MTATVLRPAAGPEPAARPAPLAGTATLIRFILRRDRVRLPAWILAIGGFTLLSVAALPDIYLDDGDRHARAALMENPGTRAISGPGYGLEDYSFGAMIANEYFSWIAIFVALMAILLTVRHTRAEEETGRAELVRAAVVGRHAPLTATLIVVGGASLVLGALVALSIGVQELESVDWAGSWLFGAALASVGVVFAAVAAVTVQASESARGAGGLGGAVFALAYLLRAAGDMTDTGGGPLSWLSPIGWAQQTRMWVVDRWWPLLLSVALATALLAVAFRLSTRRDLGAALARSRPGAAAGGPMLAGPLGLAWRLHRSSVQWWGFAVLVFALGYGTLIGEVESFAEESEVVQDFLGLNGGGAILDAFLAAIVSLMAIAVAVFAVLIVLRLRSEESAGRTEPVLATATSRAAWTGSHLVVAMAGSAVVLMLGGLGLGVSASAMLGDAGILSQTVAAAAVHVPAVWLTAGFGAALFGVLPRASLLAWLLIGYAALIGTFAAILDLPEWTVQLTPFGHIPALPAETMDWTPVLVVTAIAAALVVVGMIGFRRRDLETK